MYTVKYLGNVAEGKRVEYCNLEMKTIKNAVIKQLKDGHPVWFGSDCAKFGLRKGGYFDRQSANIEELFDIRYEFTKGERLIYGDSAGGNLAASVTQMCCDEGLLQPAGQMLIYPVTDTEQTYPDLVEYQYATWPREANIRMWKTYLDGRTPTPDDYAVPMLHEPLENLPKAYVEVAELDILCDQGEAYAEKMRQSGIDVTLQKIAGAYHGYDGDVKNAFVQNVLQTRVAWLKSALSDAVNP